MKSVEEVQQVKELKDRLELDRKGSLQVGLADRISRKPGDDDDPYAWLSQTAPASPLSQRRRRSTTKFIIKFINFEMINNAVSIFVFHKLTIYK